MLFQSKALCGIKYKEGFVWKPNMCEWVICTAMANTDLINLKTCIGKEKKNSWGFLPLKFQLFCEIALGKGRVGDWHKGFYDLCSPFQVYFLEVS